MSLVCVKSILAEISFDIVNICLQAGRVRADRERVQLGDRDSSMDQRQDGDEHEGEAESHSTS